MEILTLVRANIRRKMGPFISIAVLMAVISMALTAVLSVWNNIENGIDQAQQRGNVPQMTGMYEKELLTEKLLTDLMSHELVRDVKTMDTIAGQKLTCGEIEYSDSVFLQEVNPAYRLIDTKELRYIENAPSLKSGEIYISPGMKTNFSCEIGDVIRFDAGFETYEFKIAGVLEDPALGASVIGWKNAFISHADYEAIYHAVEAAAKSKNCSSSIVTHLYVYQKESCELSDNQFARQINLDTGIADMGNGSITKAVSKNYTGLFPKIICIILTVFVLFLLVAAIVVLCHSLSTGIEMEYTTFGIMKSLGFTKGKIRLVIAAQYLAAQILGITVGMIAAVPLCGKLGNLFFPITGVIPNHNISFVRCVGVLGGVLLILAVCIMLITKKIVKISPVRAISAGKAEIYFDSRIHLPLRKRMLLAGLAFRQFTSNKRQYIGVIAVVSILMYFMTSMMMLTAMITTTSAWESMGVTYQDLRVDLKEELPDSKILEIEQTIGTFTNFENVYRSCGNYYFSINGEQIMACIFSTPEQIKAIIRGREPLYDNEIVLTEIVADQLGLKVGDKVTVGNLGRREEYLISGLNQHENDAGENFSMSMEAASKLTDVSLSYLGYILEDKGMGEKIADTLNSKFGDILTAGFYETPMEETYQIAINGMTLIVYVFSVVFAAVVVQMVCSRAFVRERKDIGIYKALGFTVQSLRLQFAIRFLMMAFLGSFAGSVIAVLFSEKMLSSILRLMGISSFQAVYGVDTFAAPLVAISVCFFLSAWFAARKIRRVEVKELVMDV